MKNDDSYTSVLVPEKAGRRLAGRGIWLFWLATAGMVGLFAEGVIEVLALLLRQGHIAGVMNGSFAFVLPAWLADDALPTAFLPISRFAPWQSTLAAGLLALRLAPGLVLIVSLTKLFRLYTYGLIFTGRHETLGRWMAWSLVVYAFVPLVTHAALYMAGMSPVAVRLEWKQFDAVVLGVLLLAFADVIAVGTAIERDRAGFV